MISIRRSPARERNDQIREREAGTRSNREWLAESTLGEGILLLGGSSVIDFRLRVAQSHLRADLTPSCWSIAGILLDADTFASVPLGRADPSAVPRMNGIQFCSLADYDDPRRYPNIAIVQFAHDPAGVIRRELDLAREGRGVVIERGVVDLPSFIVPWLAFAWGAGQQVNPLFQERGIPSAVFVETVYAVAGVELTPGLSSASSCPEAIWQSARWWQEFYESAKSRPDDKRAAPIVPQGEFALRQPAAAVLDEPQPPASESAASSRGARASGTRGSTRRPRQRRARR
jgi:hypothetical protein